MDEIIAAVIRRRQNIISSFLIIEELRRRKNRKKLVRLWSRSWLLRRDQQKSVLNMLFKELGYVNLIS